MIIIIFKLHNKMTIKLINNKLSKLFRPLNIVVIMNLRIVIYRLQFAIYKEKSNLEPYSIDFRTKNHCSSNDIVHVVSGRPLVTSDSVPNINKCRLKSATSNFHIFQVCHTQNQQFGYAHMRASLVSIVFRETCRFCCCC